MNRTLSIPLIVLVAATLGCVTKNYVRNQVTPIINKVNELDDLTAKNTREIKETDQRAQAGVEQASASASSAVQKAQAADEQTRQAQTQADNAGRRLNIVEKAVNASDEYQVVNEMSVQFGIDEFELTSAAKAELDQLVNNVRDMKADIIVVEGFTDSTGGADDNYSLSSRRANSVRQYLATRDVPAYKIRTIGLGEDKPVASNTTKEGRAKNRRASVQLMSNAVEGSLQQVSSR